MATKAELEVLDEIEGLIERQHNVQKTLQELRNLDQMFENKHSSSDRAHYT